MSNSSTASSPDSTVATGASPEPSNVTGAKPTPIGPKKPIPEGNPAFRMMGLPRLRLPSRNWMIFLSVTGSLAGAITYDKWQTRRNKEKWCRMVSHLADETLPTNVMPRRMTVYLAAPPADSLRSGREHFHEYIKPILVAAAMDWDVIEGRKEGDVRYKTAERIRRRRRQAGEGSLQEEDEDDAAFITQQMRQKTGTTDFPGVAGDLVVGRHTWKEYVRGVHEGWLGPVNKPVHVLAEEQEAKDGKARAEASLAASTSPLPDQPKPVDAAPTPVVETLESITNTDASNGEQQALNERAPSENVDSSASTGTINPETDQPEEKKEPEVEKPKRRNPLPYVTPPEYDQMTLSTNAPELFGPSIGVCLPHILGFRNTPIRFYRFLTRRYLADDIGRQVCAAILASHRPYTTVVSYEEDDDGSAVARESLEQKAVLASEERNWWKTVYQPRKEHEESVWLENVVIDDRIAERMRVFELSPADQQRADGLAAQSGLQKGE